MSPRAWAFLAMAAGLVVMAIVERVTHRRPRMVDEPWNVEAAVEKLSALGEPTAGARAFFEAEAQRMLNDESARCYPRNWT